jgi:hypothetical protein
MKKLGLINYEGDCLVAIKSDNGIIIKDQYGVELQTMTVPELYGFIDGLIDWIDGKHLQFETFEEVEKEYSRNL